MKLNHPDAEYLDFLRQGKFMLPRSAESGRFMFYPRVAEPGTGCTDLEWVVASGRGVVYAATTVRPRAPEPPYNVSLIDLEEGPRMMSRVEGLAPELVRIGLQVRARVARSGDTSMVVFDPVDYVDKGL
ncbi:conserved hypothetical protein [Methylocella tundrae]|uniref:ChsH2 C-terminal OB-fold domain-containing protein n=1 Tax=Methylocella tundrae TaxID=227605 RepID=A0A8B6M8G2_METTU|nr:OB-fold domain-containing protein [Methylocella tundrae]VTZ26801.1 conserved hypothetical protein [Methylocella tundrae]VTZ51166.1 conserved hypothetical protein [Methylocella tundrae]